MDEYKEALQARNDAIRKLRAGKGESDPRIISWISAFLLWGGHKRDMSDELIEAQARLISLRQ